MKTTNQIIAQNNKKLLDEIMSKEEGIIYCNSVIDPNDPIFECQLSDIKIQKRDEEPILFI